MRMMILFTLLLVACTTFAQKRTSSISAGVLVGVAVSKMNFNKTPLPPPTPIITSFETSPRIGVYTAIQFSNRFSLRNEYVFSQVKNRVQIPNQEYKLSYIALPVLLTYRLGKSISIETGPELGFLISANKNTDNGTTDITHDTEERSIGLVGGASYRFSSHFSVHARYQHGLNNIGIGQRSSVSEFKLEQWQMMLQICL